MIFLTCIDHEVTKKRYRFLIQDLTESSGLQSGKLPVVFFYAVEKKPSKVIVTQK